MQGRRPVCAGVLLLAAISTLSAQQIRTPEDFIGHGVGEDYRLARWETIVEYFRHVAERSDRVDVRDMGETTEGLPMIWAEISSADTIADVTPHRENQRRIADPRLIGDEDDYRRLVETSKVPLLINCTLHSNEVGASQMSMELLHDLATGDSPRIREILERTVVLLVPSANPDGLNKIIDWYEASRGKPWEGTGMPWLYQKYAGHDNNRDWFMLNLTETRHETRMIYDVWRPTVVYDVHQMGNRTARFFVPPFHDPKNPNVPPLVEQTLLIIGGQMAQELSLEGKTGVVHGAIYDNWWAGGFRTTVYRHNMVGILTEAASANIASPVFQRKRELRGARRGLPAYDIAVNFPEPWPGGWWRLRDVVDYEKTAIMSLLTYAARYHERLQGNFVHLGRQAIERGKTEPPFAWVLPPDQRDPGSVAWMIDVLFRTGIEVHRATEAFTADGVTYPAGSYIFYCAQPYRPHLMDMMERQVYPNREAYPGGPAESPYDSAGWTLPLQMGVRRVAARSPFEAQVEKLDAVPWPSGELNGASGAARYVALAGRNDDYRLMRRLHERGIGFRLYRGGDWKLPGGSAVPAGSIVIDDGRAVRGDASALLDGLSTDLVGVASIPREAEAALVPARQPRVGLYQPWTASMDEGWTRFVLESFDVPYESVHNAAVLAGGLGERYDALVLPSLSTRSIVEGRPPETTAPEYVGGLGPDGVVRLQEFVRGGGTLVLIDRSTNLAIDHFNVPVRNVVRDRPSEEFFCPGSILRASLDTSHPLAWGMPEWVSAYFARSQAFELTGEPEQRNAGTNGKKVDPRDPARRFPATAVGRYSDTVLLESGWIRGAELIRDKPAIVDVEYGEGRIVLLGFRVQNRGQPHGTFRLLFNAIQSSVLGS
jgi:hypothetical protein